MATFIFLSSLNLRLLLRLSCNLILQSLKEKCVTDSKIYPFIVALLGTSSAGFPSCFLINIMVLGVMAQ